MLLTVGHFTDYASFWSFFEMPAFCYIFLYFNFCLKISNYHFSLSPFLLFGVMKRLVEMMLTTACSATVSNELQWW